MPISRIASILVVEDESIVALDLQQMLVEMGYDAYAIASSADEAIARVTERCPDLLLMDIRIKGDLDGIETAAILSERFLVPALFLTAHADDATIARAKTAAPYGYLLKPVRPAELKSAIEVALYRSELDKRLRERGRWSSTTLRSIGDAVITVDLKGQVTFMNPVAERLTGLTLAEALGRPATDIVGVASGNTPERVISDSVADLVDEGELLGAVLVLRDVTEQKQLQQRLEFSDRLASLGTMAAGVAHEVNNPLAVVVANASHASSELEEAKAKAKAGLLPPNELLRLFDELEQSQAEIQEAAVRIERIVSDLRLFSHPSAEAPGKADVARAIRWAERSTAREVSQRASVSVQITGSDLFAAIDELRLGQVLVNLLVNAAHAMEADDPASNRISVHAQQAADARIVIEVIDSGSGMDPATLGRIFDPFFTTKPRTRGTGLGLAICHGIVSRAGGEMQVESAVGHGSTFRLLLPPATVPQLSERASLSPVSRQRRARILVVDDEQAMLRVMQRLLRTHDVTCVSSAADALGRVAAGEHFDVICSDVMMPGMTGIDLYEALLAGYPDAAQRMVFLTGGIEGPRAHDFRRSVPNRFLTKPFARAVLLGIVADMLPGERLEHPYSDDDARSERAHGNEPHRCR